MPKLDTSFWYKQKYPQTLVEATLVHSILFTLGYIADEIFLRLDGKDVFVQLKAEDKVVEIRIGEAVYSAEKMMDLYQELSKEWNTGGTISKEEKDALFETSTAKVMQNQIVVNLALQGFNRWVQRNQG